MASSKTPSNRHCLARDGGSEVGGSLATAFPHPEGFSLKKGIRQCIPIVFGRKHVARLAEGCWMLCNGPVRRSARVSRPLLLTSSLAPTALDSHAFGRENGF